MLEIGIGKIRYQIPISNWKNYFIKKIKYCNIYLKYEIDLIATWTSPRKGSSYLSSKFLKLTVLNSTMSDPSEEGSIIKNIVEVSFC